MRADSKTLPNHWDVIKLGTYVEKEKGKKPRNQSASQSGAYVLPYIDIEAFEQGIIKSWTDGKGCRICKASDLLMVWDGSRSGLVGRGMDGALGSTLMRINFPNINNQYAFYFLLSKYQEINTRAKGSGTPHVDPDLLWNYDFPIPPSDEQTLIVAKIEELFSELDSGIASLKTAQEQLKIYRQALLKHAFEGKLTEQWRKDNADKLETPEQLLARIQTERETRYQQQLEEWKQAVKDWEAKGKEGKKPTKPNKIIKAEKLSESDLANVPSLPASWFWLKIGMLCDVVRGGSPRPAGDSRFYDGEIPFLKVADLTRVTGLYVNSAAYTIKPAGLQKTRAVSPNTLLISNSGATLGVPKICTIYATFNDGVAAFLRLGEAELKYHYYFWESKTAELRAINQGAAQPNLNTDLIKDTLFPSCSLAEQQEIVNQLEEKLSIIEQNEKEIESALAKAELLRQSILKKAFSGQLI